MTLLRTLPFVLFIGRCVFGASGDGLAERPVLDENHFLHDAYADAVLNYPESLNKPMTECRFLIYQAFSVDLDSDGEGEYVVGGEIGGQRIQVVMAYTWNGTEWEAKILNRARGGGIDDLQVVDIDNNGETDVFSVVRDDALRRYCRIYSVERGRHWREMFAFDSKGGFTNSCNISLTRAGGRDTYRVRVDEVTYPDSDEGEVEQRTYFFCIDNGQFVLEKHSKNGSKL